MVRARPTVEKCVKPMGAIGFEALHGEVNVYLVCGNIMCVFTCQVEFVC